MNEFDIKAAGWDSNPMHQARSRAVADHIISLIPLKRNMRALEFGAGTGSTSLILSDHLQEIIMMDNSAGMVQMMNEKILKTNAKNLKSLHFDLENNEYEGTGFDLIFTQMALHHVIDIDSIIDKFSNLLNTGGYLAIADLYPEDGSFHGEGFEGHKGFDPEKLGNRLKKYGFSDPRHSTCFTIQKDIPGKGMSNYDVFILTARSIKTDRKWK